MKERHKVVPAVYLFAVRDRQLLLGLRQNTGYCDGWLGLPSGHVEPGESPIQALIREAKEEIGLELQPSDVIFATVMSRISSDRECVDYFFVCDVSSRLIKNCEPDKCGFWEFYNIFDLPKEMIPYLKSAWQAAQQKRPYLEYGWNKEEK